MGLFNYLKSTILSKWVMAITGIILVLFIIGHTIGNMQVYLGKEAFNHYAETLQGLGEILWLIRIFLFICLILHIITSLRLKFLNMSARPIAYKFKNYVTASLTSRTMIWTGIMVFAFLVYHLLHFTVGVTNPDDYKQYEHIIKSNTSLGVVSPMGDKTIDGVEYQVTKEANIVYERHDVYAMVISGFQKPLISIAYIIGVILLGFHLSHAIQSAFQTIGMNHPQYFPRIVRCSNVFSTIIVLLMITLPITILLGIVGGVK